ncbi:outer membrane lipoprotein-sorting protein [Kosakonia sp. BYX6]|uniref:Outer membrane lipoprotein-sorting protein n=1 Tax=Kosakonia calanthes TaxID=3139408 RepID=A0ABZ3B0K5_9ENTR
MPMAANASQAQDIIRRADEIRSPNQPFRYTVTVREYKEDTTQEVNKQIFDISMRFMKPENGKPADARSIARFIYPPRDKGKVMLSDWYALWFYSPDLRRPMPISREQRLVGQISNSDVIVTNFDYSYNATLLGEVPCGEKICHELSLERKSEEVTYPKIVYQVEKNDYRPYQARYYAQDGKLLKDVLYQNYQYVLGKERPMKIIVKDLRYSKGFTVMDYSDVRLESLPESRFTRESIQRGIK